MDNNSIFTVTSIYKGQALAKLELSYGKLNFLAPVSGMGKTALGLFLRDESFRRLGIERAGRSFIPRLDWELLIGGNFGLVEMITPEERQGRLIDLINFRAPLEGLYKKKGRSVCPGCSSGLLCLESKSFVDNLALVESDYFLLGLKISITPQNVFSILDWSRSHAISRILINGEIQKLPDAPREDDDFSMSLFAGSERVTEAILVREVIAKANLDGDLYCSVGELLTLTEVGKAVIGDDVQSMLLCGSIAKLKERKFSSQKEIALTHPYICLNCGVGYDEVPEPTVDGLTMFEVKQATFGKLTEFFNSNFSSDWIRIFGLQLRGIYLDQPVEEISFELLLELKLLALCLQQLRDTIVFIDSGLSNKSKILAVELTTLGNAVVAQSPEGQTFEKFLPPEFQRSSALLSKIEEVKTFQRRNSVEPLIVETGVDKAVSELYASLPEARVSNLTAKELAFHAAKCPDCGGAGSVVVGIGSLGKRAELCKTCLGSRYQQKVLLVSYNDITLSKLLELTVTQANNLFLKRAEIAGPLSHLEKQGLGNYRLGDELRTLPSKGRSVLGLS